jgi:hypothetical protein
MATMTDLLDQMPELASLVAGQAGTVTRSVLRLHGVDDRVVSRQVAARRWQNAGPQLVVMFTGSLPLSTRHWVAATNAGPGSLLCGRTALAVHGLEGWGGDQVQVVVDRGVRPAPLPFVKVHESRRHRGADSTDVEGLPCHRVERAAIDVASWCPSERTAVGVLAAVVQQRLTSPARLQETLERQGRIRRRRLIAATIIDLAGGAQALSEIEYGRLFQRWGLPQPTRQAIRLDHRGRRRYLDVEWTLSGGVRKALEIDGMGHLEPNRWYGDLLRAADITAMDETPILRLPASAARIDERLVAGILKRFLGRTT